MFVKDNLLVIRMVVAGLTQWGTSWPRERVCERGGIRKNCGNLWKRQRPKAVNSPDSVGALDRQFSESTTHCMRSNRALR